MVPMAVTVIGGVLVSTVLTYGNQRFRIGAEPAIIVDRWSCVGSCNRYRAGPCAGVWRKMMHIDTSKLAPDDLVRHFHGEVNFDDDYDGALPEGGFIAAGAVVLFVLVALGSAFAAVTW